MRMVRFPSEPPPHTLCLKARDNCMATWLVVNRIALINSAGLLLDIVGAFLVAWEVVREYRGKKYQDPQGYVVSEPFVSGIEVKESPEYSAWEIRKYRRMKMGLVCLTLGFLLQILSSWLR